MSKQILTSRKGRKCKHHGCKHVLSIYNHETFCNIHSSQKPRVKSSKTM